jgi:hypothetical protein
MKLSMRLPLTVAFALTPWSLLAQAPPLAGEFAVNTSTTRPQRETAVASREMGVSRASMYYRGCEPPLKGRHQPRGFSRPGLSRSAQEEDALIDDEEMGSVLLDGKIKG